MEMIKTEQYREAAAYLASRIKVTRRPPLSLVVA